MEGSPRTVVVGAGMAGLTAATLLARGGAAVTLLEKASSPGGRARSTRTGTHVWNLGPHALYAGGAARRALRQLGVDPRGGTPRTAGFAVHQGRAFTMPGGPLSLLTTRLFGVGAKIEAGRLLASLAKVDPAPLASVSVEEWVTGELRDDVVRQLVRALIRLSTYADVPEQSAGAALANLQSAIADGVVYLDGGWQTMVDALRDVAVAAGVTIRTGTRATAIVHDGAVHAVATDDGELACDAVVVTGAPSDLTALCPAAARGSHGAAATAAIPVRAACLDLALSRLPLPDAPFALGIDVPLYFSVHSAVAALAPAGGAVVHVAKYLPPQRETSAGDDQRELEGLCDLVQPGWRAVVVEQRFLPQMVVAHDVPLARRGGLAGRPGVAVDGVRGLYVAGDWVGADGLLLDASVASAAAAARRVLDGSVSVAA